MKGHTGKKVYFSKEKAFEQVKKNKKLQMYVYSCDYELEKHYHLTHLSKTEEKRRRESLQRLGIQI